MLNNIGERSYDSQNAILAKHITLFVLKVFPLDYILITVIILKMISISKLFCDFLLTLFCPLIICSDSLVFVLIKRKYKHISGSAVMFIKFVEYISKVLYRRHIFSCLFQTTFREHHSRTNMYNMYNLHVNLKSVPPMVH